MVALGMFSSALKDLAVEENIFILSSTQTNANNDQNTTTVRNESVVRGARSIVDKGDMACVIARPSQEELNRLSDIPGISQIPNMVTDVYKMRRGRYTNVRIWSFSDLGTCRKEDLFVTNGSATEIVEIDNLKQQYINDEDKVWEINKQIQILNHQADSNISDNKKEIIEKNIEEVKARAEENKKNEPFWGLLS